MPTGTCIDQPPSARIVVRPRTRPSEVAVISAPGRAGSFKPPVSTLPNEPPTRVVPRSVPRAGVARVIQYGTPSSAEL